MNDLTTITLRMLFEHPLDIPLLQWGIFVLVVGFILTLAYVQYKDDGIDLRWLIMERPHKPSAAKIAQLTALIVSTWGFIVLTLHGQLTEMYFIGFMASWSGSAVIESYFSRGSKDQRKDDGTSLQEGDPK
jgi:hypothetical protein